MVSRELVVLQVLGVGGHVCLTQLGGGLEVDVLSPAPGQLEGGLDGVEGAGVLPGHLAVLGQSPSHSLAPRTLMGLHGELLLLGRLVELDGGGGGLLGLAGLAPLAVPELHVNSSTQLLSENGHLVPLALRLVHLASGDEGHLVLLHVAGDLHLGPGLPAVAPAHSGPHLQLPLVVLSPEDEGRAAGDGRARAELVQDGLGGHLGLLLLDTLGLLLVTEPLHLLTGSVLSPQLLAALGLHLLTFLHLHTTVNFPLVLKLLLQFLPVAVLAGLTPVFSLFLVIQGVLLANLLPLVLLLLALLLSDVLVWPDLWRIVHLDLAKQRVLAAVAEGEDEGGLLGLRGGGAVGETDCVRVLVW